MGSNGLNLGAKLCFAGLILTLAACGPRPKSEGGTWASSLTKMTEILSPATSSLKVVDEVGNPVAGAQILIGTALNAPFSGNFLTTGSDGSVVAPSAWNSSEPVTVSAANHYRVTYFGQSPGGQNLVIQSIPKPANVGLTGTTPGMTPVNESDVMDFSMVIPALHRSDILHFSIDMIVSPTRDTISVFGQTIHLPSNVTIPDQTQDYIIPVEISKPNYELAFGAAGTEDIFAIHGQFPFKSTVDAIRGGAAFYTLVNDFKFLSGGMVSTNVTKANQSLNIPVTQFEFKESNSLSSPKIGSDEVAYGVALQSANGFLLPTDVRQLTSGGQDTLHTIGGATEQLLAVVKKQSEMEGDAARGPGLDHLSATIIPLSSGVAPQVLPMMDPPTAVSPLEVKSPALLNTAKVAEVATYVRLSQVAVSTGELGGETTSLIWEAYAPNWASSLQLPTWPNEAAPSGKLRWSVAMLGGLTNSKVDLGPGLMQTVTHVTKSAVDF